MDPDETLRRIREILADPAATPLASDAIGPAWDELTQHVVALDEWLSGGGFLPRAWAGASS